MILILFFILGLVSGSFICEVADRLPRHENFITARSRCEGCSRSLAWYELIPVLSFLFLRGRCRTCGTRLSLRYPLTELVNGGLYIWVYLIYGLSAEAVIYCLTSSALFGLSLIDWKTYEIPEGFNIFILILGVINLILNISSWQLYIIGAFAVSLPLLLILLISKGRAIGGGDVKLMAAAGLLLGWKNILLAFVLACIIGSVVHLTRMKLFKADRLLALGPYLSLGIYLSLLYATPIIRWYTTLLGF